VPGLVYVWVGALSVEVPVESPKSQKNVSGFLEEQLRKETCWFTSAMLFVGTTVKQATGRSTVVPVVVVVFAGWLLSFFLQAATARIKPAQRSSRFMVCMVISFECENMVYQVPKKEKV
jgi:hypothetical protein